MAKYLHASAILRHVYIFKISKKFLTRLCKWYFKRLMEFFGKLLTINIKFSFHSWILASLFIKMSHLQYNVIHMIVI